MRKYCCDCYWFIPTEPNKLQGKCVRHWAIASEDLHCVIVSEDFHCDYHLNKNHMTWIKSSGSYFTPGGDPVWECPVCHDKHVYGLLSKRSAQHWRYDADTAIEIEFLERLYEKVVADMRGEQE